MNRGMWLLLAALVPGGLVILGLELLRRALDRQRGPHLVDELRAWHQQPPEIPAIHLPSVKPLKARHVSADRVTRFPVRQVH